MKKIVLVLFVAAVVCSLTIAGVSAKEASKENRGEKLFKEHCSECHPDGGNIIAATKTLMPKDLKANNIKTEKDIIRLMRNPGPGMIKFDKDVISEKDAKAIAEYILKTFK